MRRWGEEDNHSCLGWKNFRCFSQTGYKKKKKALRDFPGSPVAKTLHSQCQWPGSIPGQGNRSHMPQLRPHTAKQIKTLQKKKKTPCALKFPGISAYDVVTAGTSQAVQGDQDDPWPRWLVLAVQSPWCPLERGHCSLYTVDLSLCLYLCHTHHIFYTSVHLYVTYMYWILMRAKLLQFCLTLWGPMNCM